MTEELPTSVAICSSLRQLQQFERVNLGISVVVHKLWGKFRATLRACRALCSAMRKHSLILLSNNLKQDKKHLTFSA